MQHFHCLFTFAKSFQIRHQCNSLLNISFWRGDIFHGRVLFFRGTKEQRTDYYISLVIPTRCLAIFFLFHNSLLQLYKPSTLRLPSEDNSLCSAVHSYVEFQVQFSSQPLSLGIHYWASFNSGSSPSRSCSNPHQNQVKMLMF